jgi:hypothetical protein
MTVYVNFTLDARPTQAYTAEIRDPSMCYFFKVIYYKDCFLYQKGYEPATPMSELSEATLPTDRASMG